MSDPGQGQGQKQPLRRPAATNPLRRPTPVLRRPVSGSRPINGSNGLRNGNSKPAQSKLGSTGNGDSSSSTSSASGSTSASASSSQQADGGNYTEFSLRAASADEIKDSRYHVMKFHSRAKVHPEREFSQPVRFHRKDPRNMQFQLTTSEMQERSKSREDTESGDEKDKKSQGPKVDMSVVAPDGGARLTNRPFQKKTRQVSGVDEANRRLRYEEYYPWVMEDFDGKNTWVGSYEAAQSDTYALFMFDNDGFKMIPAEKWYKMTPRNKYATLTLEQAEQRMEKKQGAPRWIMKHLSEEQLAGGGSSSSSGGAPSVNMRRRFRTVEASHDPDPGGVNRNRDEDDEIDFDEEFADDEEAPVAEGNDEDLKEIEDKIKKERKGRGEEDVPENAQEDETKPTIDKEGKRLRKYLISLEKNTIYSSDDEDQNPYISSPEASDDEVAGVESAIKQEQSASPSGTRAGSPSQQQGLDLPASSVNWVRKQIGPQPPGMVVIQLPPRLLTAFPRSLWNPNAKRRREESPPAVATKKVKLEKSPSPADVPAASNGSSSSQPDPGPVVADETDPNLLTESEVRAIIVRGNVTTKQLLGELKPKLKKHPSNQERLKMLVRKVARLHEGVLVPKD